MIYTRDKGDCFLQEMFLDRKYEKFNDLLSPWNFETNVAQAHTKKEYEGLYRLILITYIVFFMHIVIPSNFEFIKINSYII